MIEKLNDINSKYKEYNTEIEKEMKKQKNQEEKLIKHYSNLLDLLLIKLECENKEKLYLINEKYQSLLKQEKKLLTEIYKNSYFNTSEIGNALAKLISSFEEKQYHYTEG